MNVWKRLRWAMSIGLMSLALTCSAALPFARAQDENAEAPAPSGGGGEAWQGYAAYAFVALLGLFIVCKSARRS